MKLQCFVLSAQGRDHNGRFVIELGAKTEHGWPILITIDNFEPMFFIPQSLGDVSDIPVKRRKSTKLRFLKSSEPVDCLYFATQRDLVQAKQILHNRAIATYESDIQPVARFLMERQVFGGCTLNGTVTPQGGLYRSVNPVIRGSEFTTPLSYLSFDIETNAHTDEILSIAWHSNKASGVAMVDPAQDLGSTYTACENEKALLHHFFSMLSKIDPDILIGWNVIQFDLLQIYNRCRLLGVAFNTGRDNKSFVLAPNEQFSTARVFVSGRSVMDVPVLLRSYYRSFEDYALDAVAAEVLGKKKTIAKKGQEKIDEIIYLFNNDKNQLARYNLQDAVLTGEIFEKTQLLPNAIQRSRNAGALLEKPGGSIQAFDYLYLPVLHRAGWVAPNTIGLRATSSEKLMGGYVFTPQAGVYKDVFVFDFKSLYPTIIMSFFIDPLGYYRAGAQEATTVRGPSKISFCKDAALLPLLVQRLFERRRKAQKDKNPYLSQAIKILMNSLYGVMGSAGSRFHTPEIAEAITRTGRELLKHTAQYFQQIPDLSVIYGDTDSLFITASKIAEEPIEFAEKLAQRVNHWLGDFIFKQWGVESKLELEFEAYYPHFLIPAMRGAEQGSKKHYCGGWYKNGELQLHFKGMEAVRTDWTELAKELQRTLCRNIFLQRDSTEHLREVIGQIRSDEFRQKLIYRKRLRKSIDQYTSNKPPHVQAAEYLQPPLPSVIAYWITTQGPQPVQNCTAELDYDHYLQHQIRPIAETLLGMDLGGLFSGQMDLFT